MAGMKNNRKGRRMMLYVLYTLLAGLILLLGTLILVSPGKLAPLRDAMGNPIENSINEKSFVTIGGVKQGMFIRGSSASNPVLLFVHGGPGFPEYFLFEKLDIGLEDYFTVCYWEQRGGGLSYSKDVPLESMNMEQFTADTIDVAKYLRERFQKDKVYLMAHSGGSFFAIQAAAEAPELFHAYIGIAQIIQQAESEKLAYRYMMDRYTAEGNTKRINELREYPILEAPEYIIPFYKSLVRDQTMHELGIGTMRTMKSVVSDIFLPVLTCRAYTVQEKFNIWAAKFTFMPKTKLVEQLFEKDITMEIPKLEIPAYFFSGAYDYTVNMDITKAYCEALIAPQKNFYSFSESAHSPMFEEPEKMLRILNEEILH